jgi:hypothetical protein
MENLRRVRQMDHNNPLAAHDVGSDRCSVLVLTGVFNFFFNIVSV